MTEPTAKDLEDALDLGKRLDTIEDRDAAELAVAAALSSARADGAREAVKITLGWIARIRNANANEFGGVGDLAVERACDDAVSALSAAGAPSEPAPPAVSVDVSTAIALVGQSVINSVSEAVTNLATRRPHEVQEILIDRVKRLFADAEPAPEPFGERFGVKLICCGRDDGQAGPFTREQAEAFRESYLSGPGVKDPQHEGSTGHERSAIIVDYEARDAEPKYIRADSDLAKAIRKAERDIHERNRRARGRARWPR